MAEPHENADSDLNLGGRRSGEDRRKAQLPFEGPDRRKGERRSGEDRRKLPRVYQK